MASKSNSILIVIPAFNEEKIIEKTALKVLAQLKNISLRSKLLIVDDGSQDDTSEKVKKLIKKNSKLDILIHKKNGGYGSAIQSGIEYAIKKKFYYALFMDCDLTNNPSDIKKFTKLTKNDFDCVKASRYVNGGKVINVPLKRVLLSRIGNLIASLAFRVGVKDCTNGFLMLKVEKFKKTKLKEKGFAVILEEIYILKKKKATFAEIPIILTNRKSGKTSFRYNPTTFYNYLKYPIKSLWI